jgi:Protein of unknown function (DUF4232)
MNVRKPARLLVAGAAALAATVLLAACNDDAGAQAQSTAPGKATAPAAGAPSTGPAATKPSGPAASQTAAQSAGARCTTDELDATVQIQGPGSGMLLLKNKGSRTCTLYGYPGYAGLRADNSVDALPVKREPHPGPPVPITLKPGTNAFAGLTWSSCDKADSTCHVVTGLQLTPPDETRQLIAEVDGTDAKPVLQLLVSAAGLTTGSLQPSNQGVVFAGP